MTCALLRDAVEHADRRDVPEAAGSRPRTAGSGTTAMLGTVLPAVKFSVEVVGKAPESPFQAARKPEPAGLVTVRLTANALMWLLTPAPKLSGRVR